MLQTNKKRFFNINKMKFLLNKNYFYKIIITK